MSVSTTTSFTLLDSRVRSGTVTLPLTTTIPGRTLTFKDSTGAAGVSSVTLSTSGGETFEDGTTTKIINTNYGVVTLTGGAGKWYIAATNQPTMATISSLTVSSINGQLPITLPNIVSTVGGLNTYISSMIDPTELTSSIIGLGTSGFVSTLGLTYTVASTAAGLGTLGYTSTSQLLSTTVGTFTQINNSIANTVAPQFISTVQGLGTVGYISTATLTSTVAGLTTTTSTLASTAFTGAINAISTGALTASTISVTTSINLVDTVTRLLGLLQQQNSILYFNSLPVAGTLAWYGQVIVPPGPPLILTFPYTGSAQTWTVPNGLTSINVYMWAAGGGGSTTAAGGAGAFVQAAVPVTPGETLTFIVGGGGGNASASSAYGGGGIGGTSANSRGGGGRTAILRGSIGSADFVTVGAGGGASVFAGNTNGAGAGGIGTGSAATGTNGLEGLGGTQSTGGAGTSGNLTAGTSGSQYVGGNAGSNGGGGGAGYYGGGGSGTSTALGASGGGGSSLVNNVLPIVLAVSANGYSAPNTSSGYYASGVAAGGITSGGSGGNGLIVVSYTAGPPTTPTGLTLTLNGSTATMSWSNTSAALYYWAFYGGSSNAYSGTYLTSGSTTGTSVSYSISMTFFDYFYVVGLSPLGCISPIASSPIIQVPMPSNLSLIANGTSVVMSWSAVSGATSYTYGLYSNSSYAYTGSSVATGSVGTTTASYSSGVVGTYYYFTVLATTSTGTSLTAISGIIQDVPALSFTYSGTVSSNISTGVTYYSFLTSGNLVTPTTQNINYLLIGGGGGGGGGIGAGGGGAGADVIGTYSLSAGTYSVTIGAGGAGLPGSSGTQGPGSVGLSTIINGTTLGVPGGGAGGGGSASTGAGGAIATSTTGGGGGGSYTSGNSAAGGGGGVGSAGLNGGGAGGPNSGGGNGGTGITYAGFQLGGGGAGSGWVGGNVGGGTATYGGGNGGTNNAVTNAGCNAIANTGAGGGGGTYGGGVNSYGGGGNGGTGIVILSYPPVTPSPTNLALTPAVGNTATLSWTPSAGATGYSWVVYQSATNSYNGTSFSTGSTNSTTYTATVSGLNLASYYYFTVIATGSPNSAAAASAIMYELPDPPTPAITMSATTVNMSWTAVSGALYYTYTVFQASGYAYSGTQVATANNGTAFSASYTGIAGNYYYFTVTVTTSVGTSAAAMSGIVQAVTTPLSIATTFTYTGTLQSYVASSSAITLYMWGAGGGAGGIVQSGSNAGGAGAFIQGTLTVTQGSTYSILVGSGGNIVKSGSASSTFGGGGAMSNVVGDGGGTGGGRSAIQYTLSVTISNASGTGSVVTYTCTGNHGLVVGEPVIISGITVTPAYNGTFAVASVPTTSTFTVSSTTSGTFGGTGTIIAELVDIGGGGGGGGFGAVGGAATYSGTANSGTYGANNATVATGGTQTSGGVSSSTSNGSILLGGYGSNNGGAAGGGGYYGGGGSYYNGGGGGGSSYTTNGFFTLVAGSNGTGASAPATGSTYYSAGVAAGGGASNGGNGLVVIVAPGSVSSLLLVTSGGSATMSWATLAGSPTYYWNLYQSSSNSYTGASFSNGSTSLTSVTATGLNLNSYYYFTVYASNAGGTSPAVASAIVLELITGPATATLTSIGNTMSMSWSAVSGATNYAYSLYTGAANSYAGMAFVTSGSTASTSATYTTGVANNYYYFTVTATTASGTSAPLSSGITQCWLPSSSSTPLITWLNGSTLTSSSTNWANSGTNGGTATFSNAYSMVQVNGIYAVSFSTASGYVSFPVTSSAANRTVLVVLKFGASLTTSAGAYANILSCTAWGCELVYSSGTSYYYNWDYGGVAAWGYSSMFNANQTSLPAVFGGIIVGATGLTTSFYNGVAPTSTPQQTANVPTGTNVTGTVPGQYRTGVNPPCTVCEVIMYDGALSAGDAALCLAYLRAKWATG